MVKSVFVATTIIAKLMVSFNLSLIVASLIKILPDNCLCLVESDKQRSKEIRSKSQLEKRQRLSESGFVARLVPPSFSTDKRINHRNLSASLTTNTRTCVVRYFASLGFLFIFCVGAAHVRSLFLFDVFLIGQ